MKSTLSNLCRARRAALATMLAAGTLGAVSAGAARAGTFICVPASAGASVTSGGPSGSCAAGTPVELPASRADQQTMLAVLPYLSFKASGIGAKPTITFTGANVQVVKRADSAATTVDGTGNLIVGPANNPNNRARLGSANLVVGDAHGWTGQNALLGGFNNEARGLYGVAVGQDGLVSGYAASVLGGAGNAASGPRSTVAGGAGKIAATTNELIADGVGFNTVRRAEACVGTCNSKYYDTYLEAWAGCPSGTTLVGGGHEVVPGRYSNGTKYPVQVQRNGPLPGYDYWVVGVNVQQLSFQDLKAYALCVGR